MFNRYDGSSTTRKSKWWKPKDEKQRKEFEMMKGDVRSLLISSKEGITARGFYKQLTDLTEGEVEYRALGFNTFGEFLFHCDDVLEVRTDGYDGYYLFLRGGQAGEDHEHLRKLVQGQQNSKSGYKGFKARLSNTQWARPDVLLNVLRGPQTSNLSNPPKPAPNRFGSMGRKSFPRRTNGYQNNRSNVGPRFNSSTMPSRMTSMNGNSNYKDDRVVRPGLLNAVMSMMPDEDSDGEDMDDFDWSVPDAKPKQTQPTSVTKVSGPKSDYDDWALGTTIEIGKKQDDYDFAIVTNQSQTAISSNIKSTNSGSRQPNVGSTQSKKYDSDDDWTNGAVIANAKKVEYAPAAVTAQKQNGESNASSQRMELDPIIKVDAPKSSVARKVLNPFMLQQQAPTESVNDRMTTNNRVLEKELPVAMDVVDRAEMPAKPVHILTFKEMVLPSTVGFPARLLGVDAYGFFYIQYEEPTISASFVELKRGIQEYFATDKMRDHYRLSSNDISPGLMVIIHVDNQFMRAKIFEKDDQNKYCIAYDLEEHDFHTVPFKDIYGITEKFAKRLPQAVMCILGGMEPFLLTPKVARGFEITPVSPPEVKVTVMKEKDGTFNLPVVMMSHGPYQEDLALLIRKNGAQFLNDPSYQELQAIKQRQNDLKKVLEQKIYIPRN